MPGIAPRSGCEPMTATFSAKPALWARSVTPRSCSLSSPLGSGDPGTKVFCSSSTSLAGSASASAPPGTASASAATSSSARRMALPGVEALPIAASLLPGGTQVDGVARYVASQLDHDRDVAAQRHRSHRATPALPVHEHRQAAPRARREAQDAALRQGLAPDVEEVPQRERGAARDFDHAGGVARTQRVGAAPARDVGTEAVLR